MKISEMVVVHVRRWVQGAQRAVQAQGRFGITFFNALAHLHLHEVTGFNHAFGFFNGSNVVSLGKVALGRVAL